jgi:DNA gyrase subunit A
VVETLGDNVVFATRKGVVKKTNLGDFSKVRKGGIIAIKIAEGDELIEADLTRGSDQLVLITRDGMSLRFREQQLRRLSRNSMGVRGIKLRAGDIVVAMAVVDPQAMLLVASENGIGKRTPFDEYNVQGRGGFGVITMKTGDKTGQVVNALTVVDADELMLTTNKGKTVRTRVAEIRSTGRNTIGVKLIDLSGNEKLQDIARVISQPDEDEPPASPGEGAPGAAVEGPADG